MSEHSTPEALCSPYTRTQALQLNDLTVIYKKIHPPANFKESIYALIVARRSFK
jgi:hypothetical protein